MIIVDSKMKTNDIVNMVNEIKAVDGVDFVLSFDVRVFNVGSDEGYSVREVINEFNNQIDQPLKFVYRPRREGDVQMCVADISKIKNYNELPENCKKYINFIEEFLGCPVSMVSVGPERTQNIYLKDL